MAAARKSWTFISSISCRGLWTNAGRGARAHQSAAALRSGLPEGEAERPPARARRYHQPGDVLAVRQEGLTPVDHDLEVLPDPAAVAARAADYVAGLARAAVSA